MNGMCVVSATACQATGTVFDPATGTCKKPSDGMQVATANFIHGYQHMYYAETTAVDGGTGDGGTTTTYKVVGNFTTRTATQLAPSTQLFRRDGKPIGGGMYRGVYPLDQPRPTPTVLDPNYRITLGDYEKCSGSAAWYKPPMKVNGKAVYKHVVDVANCVPNTLYTVWFFWSPDKTRANSVIAAPAGGLPNAFITDDAGAGHWERTIDSDVWMKSGIMMPYAGAHVTPPTIPDITKTPDASLITVLIYHNNQQTNGNPGWVPVAPLCATDMNGVCLSPQPENVINLGRTGIDSHHQMLNEPGFPLSQLQPY
jgi:hypothetical protein